MRRIDGEQGEKACANGTWKGGGRDGAVLPSHSSISGTMSPSRSLWGGCLAMHQFLHVIDGAMELSIWSPDFVAVLEWILRSIYAARTDLVPPCSWRSGRSFEPYRLDPFCCGEE